MRKVDLILCIQTCKYELWLYLIIREAQLMVNNSLPDLTLKNFRYYRLDEKLDNEKKKMMVNANYLENEVFALGSKMTEDGDILQVDSRVR